MAQVSVIIPTYYRNDRLRVAIKSAQEQTHDAIDIVVVDDSGEEYARDVVRSIEGEVTYVPHDTNEGAHAARDTGLHHTSSDYVQFLDDDDRLYATKIEKQVALLTEYENVGVAYSGLEYEDGRKTLPDTAVAGDVLEDVLSFYDHPLTTSTMLIDAALLAEIQPLYRDSAGADDIRMSIELAKRTRFDFINEILVTAGRSEKSRGMSWGGVEGRWSILSDYDRLYEEVPYQIRREAIAETYQLQGRRYLDDNVWSLAAIYSFGQALKYAPEITSFHVGEFISAFGGRPGRNLARSLIQ